MTKTQEYLESLDACREAREWVGDRTLKEAWDVCDRLDWMQWLLEAPILAEYRAREAPIWAEYNAKRAPIWAECSAKRDLIWAEYEAKCELIWAEYSAKHAPIWAEYMAKCEPILACETCDEIRGKFSCPEVAA